MNSAIDTLQTRIEPLYEQLSRHRLYASFHSLEDLHLFLESHVFAVWDFMSLLKALQRGLTSVEIPWLPSPLPECRRLVNEIVFGEESDVYGGKALSHFELYRLAMEQCGANVTVIDTFVQKLREGTLWVDALRSAATPAHAADFVRSTFGFIETGKLHVIAAAFTFGREDLIPDMFRGFIRDQDQLLGGRLATLRWYLERHIEVDGDEHGPMALRMVGELCGDDTANWQEATDAAVAALQARLALWDGIASAIEQQQAVQAVP